VGVQLKKVGDNRLLRQVGGDYLDDGFRGAQGWGAHAAAFPVCEGGGQASMGSRQKAANAF
jgi:hypothetical protein